MDPLQNLGSFERHCYDRQIQTFQAKSDFFYPPVQPCAEIIGELHLQWLIGILEGSKLAEKVSHLSACTSLFVKECILFAWNTFLTLSSLAMRTCPIICPTVARSMFRFLTFCVILASSQFENWKQVPARQIAGRRELLSPDLDPPTIPCWLSEDAKCHQGVTQPGLQRHI